VSHVKRYEERECKFLSQLFVLKVKLSIFIEGWEETQKWSIENESWIKKRKEF